MAQQANNKASPGRYQFGCYMLLVPLLAVLSLPVHAAPDEVSIGIFPRRDAQMTRKMFTPLMEFLTERLGVQVKLETPPDFPSFWKYLVEKKYDVVHFNQYHYIKAHAKHGYNAILHNEEFGESTLAAAIWVREDSGIKTPLDLRGSKIIFGGGKQAMVSYIMATDLLRSAGLKEGDYLSQFTLHPVKALVSLYYRQGQAAGIGNHVHKLPAVKDKLDVSKVKILMESAPLPHLPWAVAGSMPQEQVDAIQNAMLSLNGNAAGRAILKSMAMTGIAIATDQNYDTHREIVERVLGEKY